MLEIEKPNITIAHLSEDGTKGVFVVDPLERGYGITLGNSLRRIMLSSLQGVAVTSIKIDGVLHEFSTIPGVKEDVTEIVLNVKGITAKLFSNTVKTAIIDVTGPCNITAGDIKQDADLEILNPDHHIATLAENERFYMELTFDHGRGYVSQERNKQLANMANGAGVSAPIGTIYTDSIYTPVYKVNYNVESTRVGNITDLDKLTIGGTNYILLEMPYEKWKYDTFDEIYNITQLGFKPIMAHLDRFLDQEHWFGELFGMDLLYQINSCAFIDKNTRKMVARLFEKNAIHIIGSDTHNLSDRKPDASAAYEIVSKKFGKEYVDFFEENGRNILENKDVANITMPKLGIVKKLLL